MLFSLSLFLFIHFFHQKKIPLWNHNIENREKAELFWWQAWLWSCQRALSSCGSVRAVLLPPKNLQRAEFKHHCFSTLLSSKAACAVGRARVNLFLQGFHSLQMIFFFPKLEFFHSSVTPFICTTVCAAVWEEEG